LRYALGLMRLVQKLSLGFMVATTGILAVNGYFRVHREIGLFQADRVRDHDLIGRALGAAVGAVWRSEGEARAMQLLEAAKMGEGRVRIRWVWLDREADIHVDPSRIEQVGAGATLTRLAPDAYGENERFTYVPLMIGERRGALELAEPLAVERLYRNRTIVETVRTTAALALVTALVSYVLGFLFVGRPVRALVAKARRMGQGEFAEPVRLSQRDEFTEIAEEMNATSDRLVEAHQRVARETATRIAALEQLRHADRLATVGKLASGVAHELGTPLNVVIARAEMIASGEASPPEAIEYGRIIADSGQKMIRIIRQLLEFARRRGPHTEAHDLARLVRHMLELLRPLADPGRVGLALDAPGDAFVAQVDAPQIEQALTNLVVNAIQASGEGRNITVSLRREHARAPDSDGGRDGDWIAVRVQDEGCGIPAETLPRVFEPFFTTKDVGKGTGLGLSVAHGIVRDHGGWIDARSDFGYGSTFSLFLPVEA
jgi:two-component system NtrC family sensor kinase